MAKAVGGWAYALYKRHRASSKWTRVGSYQFRHIAELNAEKIKKDNKYMRTRITKVRSLTVKPVGGKG